MDYLERIKKIKSEINKLKDKIKEKEANLPAHSINPVMVQEIEVLEEELKSKIEEFKKIKSS